MKEYIMMIQKMHKVYYIKIIVFICAERPKRMGHTACSRSSLWNYFLLGSRGTESVTNQQDRNHNLNGVGNNH